MKAVAGLALMMAITLLTYVALCLTLPKEQHKASRTEISMQQANLSASLRLLLENHPALQGCRTTNWRSVGSGTVDTVAVSFEVEEGIGGELRLWMESSGAEVYLVQAIDWSVPFFRRGRTVLNGSNPWPMLESQAIEVLLAGAPVATP
jgi:hypothetical protein